MGTDKSLVPLSFFSYLFMPAALSPALMPTQLVLSLKLNPMTPPPFLTQPTLTEDQGFMFPPF